jgi:elongation factor Ts
MEITAAQVKELRDRTSAGMMNCKKALVECEGDIEKAIDWLRQKGLSAAAKKAGRTTSEGLIGVCVADKKGTLVEVNAETDFVARNDTFKQFVSTVACVAQKNDADVEKLATLDYPETERNVADELTNMIATIGENMSLRRVAHLSVNDGAVVAYMHNKVSDELGQIGVLVALESTGDKAKLQEFGKKVAMHIAASNPLSVSVADLDPEAVARERAVVEEQAKASGKKPEFIGKIVEGRLHKFYEESVLLEQKYVMDDSLSVKEVVANLEKDLGTTVKIAGFVKYKVGEGIEKQVTDFASEVAAQLG